MSRSNYPMIRKNIPKYWLTCFFHLSEGSIELSNKGLDWEIHMNPGFEIWPSFCDTHVADFKSGIITASPNSDSLPPLLYASSEPGTVWSRSGFGCWEIWVCPFKRGWIVQTSRSNPIIWPPAMAYMNRPWPTYGKHICKHDQQWDSVRSKNIYIYMLCIIYIYIYNLCIILYIYINIYIYIIYTVYIYVHTNVILHVTMSPWFSPMTLIGI